MASVDKKPNNEMTVRLTNSIRQSFADDAHHLENLRQIAQTCRVCDLAPEGWLPAGEDLAKVAVAQSAVPCGFPSPALDYADEELSLTELMVANPTATFFAELEGDAMLDAGLSPGDTLVIDRSIPARSGDIVLAVVEGGAEQDDERGFVVRRLRIPQGRPEAAELAAENAALGLPPIRAQETSFSIEGVLTGLCRRLRRP